MNNPRSSAFSDEDRSRAQQMADAFGVTYYLWSWREESLRHFQPTPPPSGVELETYIPGGNIPHDPVLAYVYRFMQIANWRVARAAQGLLYAIENGHSSRARAALSVVLDHLEALETDEWRRRCQAAAR